MSQPAPVVRAICFDWGGTLMSEDGPQDIPMCDWQYVDRIPGALEAVSALYNAYPLCIATMRPYRVNR